MIALLTTADAARILGVCRSRVRALAKARGVGTKLTGAWFFTPDEVEAMQPGAPGRPPKAHTKTKGEG